MQTSPASVLYRAKPTSLRRTPLGWILIFWLGTAASLAATVCNPRRAPELFSVTIENSGATDLHDYPVAIVLDETNFDSQIFDSRGFDTKLREGEVSVWEEASGRPLPYWLESYDPSTRKGLLWVKLSFVGAQSTIHLSLMTGRVPHCSAQPGNGYAVFPFFSDVHDLKNWHRSPDLSLTDDVTVGPLHVEDRRVIESDGTYNSTPSIAQASNGDWVLSYLKGTNHVNGHTIVLRRSQDHGKTWSPEIVYFDTAKPDPSLLTTPDGKMLISFVKRDLNANVGAAYSISSDNGLTWDPFTFLDHPVNKTFAFTGFLSTREKVLYGATYGPTARDPTVDVPGFWASDNNGVTWTERSQISQPGDPGLNETTIARTGIERLLAISRADDDAHTYGHESGDLGITWGPLRSYTTQVGSIDYPQLIHAGRVLLLLGRENLGIADRPETVGFPRQLVAFVSYDEGKSFRYGTVLDTYTGDTIDGAYCWPLPMPDGRIFVVYYADSHGLRQPDIKSLILSVDRPHERESQAIHLLTHLADSQATRPLNFDLQHYSLDFRFHSRMTPAGSQFFLALNGPSDAGTTDLVRWELPSTHAVDPTSTSGFIAQGQFVPLLNSFAYGQEYRVRTIVDESQGTQEAQILDPFGQVTADQPEQPLAAGESLHPTALTIGNNSTLRATDTLLDFVFIRPVAEIEPAVTVTRVH